MTLLPLPPTLLALLPVPLRKPLALLRTLLALPPVPLRTPLLLRRKPRSTKLRLVTTSFEGAQGNLRALSFVRLKSSEASPHATLDGGEPH